MLRRLPDAHWAVRERFEVASATVASYDPSFDQEGRVLKAGIKDPIAVQRGIAIYTDVGERSLTIPVDEKYASAATGRVTVQYVEPGDNGMLTLAETDAVLN